MNAKCKLGVITASLRMATGTSGLRLVQSVSKSVFLIWAERQKTVDRRSSNEHDVEALMI